MVTGNVVVDTTEIATQVAEAAAGIGSLISGFRAVEQARAYYNLYKRQRQFYYDVFQTGAEAPLARQVVAIPVYNIDYAGRAATAYDTVTGPFGGRSADISGWWSRHAVMYCMVMDPRITELEVDRARLQSDWTNYLFRFEELWADARNDQRWAKRMALHNIGIKQGTAITSSLNSSVKEYQSNIRDLSSQLATYGNGIAKYAGYKRGLADTHDDFTRGTTFKTQTYNQTVYGMPSVNTGNTYDNVNQSSWAGDTA